MPKACLSVTSTVLRNAHTKTVQFHTRALIPISVCSGPRPPAIARWHHTTFSVQPYAYQSQCVRGRAAACTAICPDVLLIAALHNPSTQQQQQLNRHCYNTCCMFLWCFNNHGNGKLCQQWGDQPGTAGVVQVVLISA